MVTVRVCSKQAKNKLKSVVFTNKVGKNSRYFVGVFNKTIIPLVPVGYELAIIISYPTSVSGIIVLLKMPTKYREFFPTLFVKTTDFQFVLNFEQTRTVTIWRVWKNGSYTMIECS